MKVEINFGKLILLKVLLLLQNSSTPHSKLCTCKHMRTQLDITRCTDSLGSFFVQCVISQCTEATRCTAVEDP